MSGASRSATGVAPSAERTLYYLRATVYLLASLLCFSLLVVGTVAVIAELKGTWHWAIHLESTISYMGLFVAALMVPLVPLTAALFVSRWWFDA
ncbi:hypothetical protein [Haloprofundus salinisoli]|uniref:hypothetical protein n=1 Tax=Haloprofundus salinisoli TaxID=2876193 RepID=UPI001CCA49B9|nr:hypothetical protein [Haloprofundus salinisoli]